MVWGLEQIVVARNPKQLQDQVNGGVFASNGDTWRLKVVGSQRDVEQAKDDSRVNKAFEKKPPYRLEINDPANISTDYAVFVVANLSAPTNSSTEFLG